MAKKTVALAPYLDAPFTPADVSALAALFLGTADEHQQKRAREWILLRACRLNGSTFDPDPSVSSFLQGRREVGRMILNAARTSAGAAAALEDLNKKDDET